MPRKKGSVHTTGRRSEDGRWNKGKSVVPKAKVMIEEPPVVTTIQTGGDQPVARIPEDATPSDQLGYLHKKFKKVAATTFQAPEPAPVPEPPPVEEVPKTDEIAETKGPATKTGGRYVCPYCQHACAKPSVLEKHIRAHTNERPYPCVPCGFAFKTKSNLYKHCKSRTHVLKLEETGATVSAPVDVPEGPGSDDTSDDNVNDNNILEDSEDEEEAPVPVVPEPIVESSPEKFKTPYKPKFHNFKVGDGALSVETEVPTTTASIPEGSLPGNRPDVLERISQIISKNEDIVGTTPELVWPRRYVRQSSRDSGMVPTTTPKTVSGSVRNDLISPGKKLTGRERCSSFNDPSSNDNPSQGVTNVSHPALRVLQEEDETHRKRCFSDGPADTNPQLRHSILNLVHQPSPPKQPRTVESGNSEGSIIRNILLKSRGLLPTETVESDAPKMSSSFSVRALLNPTPLSRGKPLDPSADDEAEERPIKKSKLSPPTDLSLRFEESDQSAVQVSTIAYASREESYRNSSTIRTFGGKVEIHDLQKKAVLRMDQEGEPTFHHRSNGSTQADDPIVSCVTGNAKPGFGNSGGGIVQLEHRESRLSVFPVNKNPVGLVFDRPNVESTVNRSIVIHRSSSPRAHNPPYVPGIPGPYSSSGWLPSSTTCSVVTSAGSRPICSTSSSVLSPVPLISVHPSNEPEEQTESRFLRPSSLSLQPGTFTLKKANMAGVDLSSGLPNMLCVSGPGVTLISPETPRPRKLIRQLYLNGHAYTYLGLKCSTRVYFCCLSRAQPMYVLQQCHPKLSMYSQWKTRAPATDGLEAASPVQTMMLYDSRQRPLSTTTAQSSDSGRMILTHSSYWTNRDRPTTTHLKLEVMTDDQTTATTPLVSMDGEENLVREGQIAATFVDAPASPQPASQPPAPQPKRIKIFAGGYKSTEEYTYVRGRGRGRYVCEECGIRCKKPSMLKKHIRTHTDLRPYTCRQCNFSFKTKGNLTKHMKSKAHHKKCTELGIVPVPTAVDDANIDEDSLARQESLKKMKQAGGGSGNEGDSDLDDDDDEDDDEDDDDEGEEEEEETEEDHSPADIPAPKTTGQFEDSSSRCEREQEVARSLLDLGVMAPAGSKPTTYPYASHFHHSPMEVSSPSKKTVPIISELKEEKIQPTVEEPLKTQQPIDLSTLRSSPAQSEVIQRSPVPTESADTIQPMATTSGMLQAYLTEKALKDGKRPHVRMMTPVVNENKLIVLPAQVGQLVGAQSNHSRTVILPNEPSPQKIRPEFMVPSSSSSSAVVAAAAAAAAAASASSSSASSQAASYRLTDDGKTACSTCNKVFTKPSQLQLHINIHYFERPFRCEACAVSFRTKGHLQKHKRSVTHFNKVNMNLTFGTPSTENPRPFKCSDCMIAFRIHGHLAKHLRSKMHIMKLECLGKLPFGTYAEMERSGVNLNEIDTTDCINSLESLQSLAHRLYKQDPSKIQQWQQEAQGASESAARERTISGSSEEFSDVADEGDEMDEDGEDSDGLPDGAVADTIQQRPTEVCVQQVSRALVASPTRRDGGTPNPLPPPIPSPSPRPITPSNSETKRALPVMFCSACGESCSAENFQQHLLEKHRSPAPSNEKPTPISPPPPVEPPSKPHSQETDRIVNLAMDSKRTSPRPVETKTSIPNHWNLGSDLQYNQQQVFYHPGSVSSTAAPPPLPPPPPSQLSGMWLHRPPAYSDFIGLNPLTGMPPHWHQDPAAMAWIASRHMMLAGQAHPHNFPMPPAHSMSNGALPPRHYSPSSTASNHFASEEPIYCCEICARPFTSKDSLRQHMLAHAQPRPFVCEFCDAGFTTQKQLESHLVLHRPRT